MVARSSDVAALWPLWLLRAQVCLVYLASGFSKLVDPDWFGGLVLWDRVVRYQYVLEPTPLPAWAVDLLTERWLYYVVGPAAVFTELFIGIGLWFGRTRLAAVWVAIVFHLLIEVSASVEVFSYRGHRRPRHLGDAVDSRPHRPRRRRCGDEPCRHRPRARRRLVRPFRGRARGPVRAGDHASSIGTERVHTGAAAASRAAQPAAAHVPGGRAGSAPRRHAIAAARRATVAV